MKVDYNNDASKGPIKTMKIKAALAALKDLDVTVSINGKLFNIDQAIVNVGEEKSSAKLIDRNSEEIRAVMTQKEIGDKTKVIVALQVPM